MTASAQPPLGAQPGNRPKGTASAPGAFGERQGNGERSAMFGERRADPHQDVSDPRKPGDPSWRGRTARRSSTPAAMSAFRCARRRRGWPVSRAAEAAGISRPHLSLLERGLRRPSKSVAERIIEALAMTPAEAKAVRSVAVPLAGRDSPYRSGWRPTPPRPAKQEEGGRAVLGPRRNAPQARQEPAESPETPSWDSAYAPDDDGGGSESNPWAQVYGTSAEAMAAQRLEGLRSSPWRR